MFTFLAVERNELEKGFHNLEKGLNLAGYIPGLCTFSGPYRVMWGILETVTSIAVVALDSIKALFTWSSSARKANLKKAAEPLVYVGHGIGNFIRGQVEMIFPLNLLGIIWDIAGERLKYGAESPHAKGRLVTTEGMLENIRSIQSVANTLFGRVISLLT